MKYFGIENFRLATIQMQEWLKLIVKINAKTYDLTYYYSMDEKLNHLTYTDFDISIEIGIYLRFFAYPQQLRLTIAK